jgi:hypothetical protein
MSVASGLISIKGNIHFKIRFNTLHGDTDWFWRIIIEDVEYLARHVNCMVPTQSDASFDKNAGVIKYHMAGDCKEFNIDEAGNATFI